ncbi:hypothetical protein ACLOJK_014294 [Asimina triloba]
MILGSDVIYSEGAVADLLITLRQLSGTHTTIFIAGELRNDVVLEYFLEEAIKEFVVGRVDQEQWHPDYCSHRVAMFVLVAKSQMTKSEGANSKEEQPYQQTVGIAYNFEKSALEYKV